MLCADSQQQSHGHDRQFTIAALGISSGAPLLSPLDCACLQQHTCTHVYTQRQVKRDVKHIEWLILSNRESISGFVQSVQNGRGFVLTNQVVQTICISEYRVDGHTGPRFNSRPTVVSHGVGLGAGRELSNERPAWREGRKTFGCLGGRLWWRGSLAGAPGPRARSGGGRALGGGSQRLGLSLGGAGFTQQLPEELELREEELPNHVPALEERGGRSTTLDVHNLYKLVYQVIMK